MNCPHCGQVMNKSKYKDPWCMYQVKDGRVINELFHPDAIPKGWYDSPPAAQKAADKADKAAKKVKTPEVANDNSAGANQLVS